MLRNAFFVLGIVVLLLVIAAAPALIRIDADGLALDLESAMDEVFELFRSIADGTVLEFDAGKTPRNFMEVLPAKLSISVLYVGSASLLSLVIGLTLGFLTSFHRGRMVTGFLELLHVIPDFVLAIFLQIIVILVTQATGVRIARVGYVAGISPAYALPLTVMTVVASVFIIRSVHGYLVEIKSRDYILNAVMRGLTLPRIIGTHLFVPVLHKLKGDIPGLLALLIGNLFIIERIFNIPGITSFIFLRAFRGVPGSSSGLDTQVSLQINVILFGFAAVILLYWLLYMMFHLFINLLIAWRSR